MKNEFEIKAEKYTYGNMKGSWEKKLPDDVIMLSGAEMDFPTAPVIRQKIVEVANNGLYGYTLPDQRYLEAIVNWMDQVRNVKITPDMIVPTLGTIMALNITIRAFTNMDDEVIIQSPSYNRFDRAIINNQRKIIYNPMMDDHHSYKIDYLDLEEKMKSPKAKLLVLCHPHNPSGKVFTLEELQKINELACKYHVLIFCDEIFGEYQFFTNTSLGQVGLDHCILSTSLGKSFNFTGVNHANVIIKDPRIREQFIKQRNIDHFGSLDPFFYNALIAAYSKEGYEWIQAVKGHVYAQYKYLLEGLKDTNIHIFPLEGTFICWLDLSGLHIENLEEYLLTKWELCADLGEEYGEAYQNYIRINLATSHQNIQQLVSNIRNTLI